METATAARALAGSPSGVDQPPSSCYLCGSAKVALRFAARASRGHPSYSCTSFGHRAHGPIWACRSCGLWFQWPMPDPTTLLAAYGAVEDPLYLAERTTGT